MPATEATSIRRKPCSTRSPSAATRADIEGLIVAICGDILHSRVARSNILLLNTLGARVRVVAPSTLLAAGIERLGVEVYTSMWDGLADADIVMMLRLQRERMTSSLVPSTREYFHFFGLDYDKLARAKPDALVMHPGPMNRGVEIDSNVADDRAKRHPRASRDGRGGPHGRAAGARAPSAERMIGDATLSARATLAYRRLDQCAPARSCLAAGSARRPADQGRPHRRSSARMSPKASQAMPRLSIAAATCSPPVSVDMMVFTGEPGHEHRETLATASRAAAAGGVTTIVCMPNTDPVIDDVALVDFILRRARDTALVNVHPMAAMTKGLLGEEMSEIGLLRDAGAIAFANGKASLANAKVMRNVLAYAKDFGALIVHHLEDPCARRRTA